MTEFIDILNLLGIGKLKAEHFEKLMGKVLSEASGEFSIHKAIRIYLINKQITDHNELVIQYFRNKNVKTYMIRA